MLLLSVQQNESVIHLHISALGFLFEVTSHIGQYSVLSWVSYAIGQVLIIIYFIYNSICVNPNIPIYPSTSLSLGFFLINLPHKFVFYICDCFYFVYKSICTFFFGEGPLIAAQHHPLADSLGCAPQAVKELTSQR